MSKDKHRDIPLRRGGAGKLVRLEMDRWEALRRLAEELGNVSEACRRVGVPRHTYYEWEKKAGLEPKTVPQESTPPRSRHPQSVPEAWEREIVELAIENPDWGCDRIAYYLKIHRKTVSSPTVQKILIRNKLGRRSQRLMRRNNFQKDRG